MSLAVYCEDSNDELWRRQRDINLDYGVSNNDLGDVHWMPRLGEDNLMMVFGRNGAGELTKFHQHILIASLDLKARLVIIDTAADVFGGNENDRNHVRQFVSRALGSIAQKINGAVLLCAHPSRTGLNKGADGAEGDSGSTGWSNSLRSRLFLRTPSLDNGEVPDPNARVLQRKKANYATRNDEIKLRWRNGVIEPEAPVSPGATAFGKIDVKDVFVGLLDEFAGCETASIGQLEIRKLRAPDIRKAAARNNATITARRISTARWRGCSSPARSKTRNMAGRPSRARK